MKEASEPMVEIRSIPHYGEKAVFTGRCTNGSCEVILLDCKLHGVHRTWIQRSDI